MTTLSMPLKEEVKHKNYNAEDTIKLRQGIAILHNGGQTDNHPSHVFEQMTIYYQQQLKLRDDKIIELERIIYAQQQSLLQDDRIFALEKNFHAMSRNIITLLEHMRDQRMSEVYMLVLNSTTNNFLNSIPNEVRNKANFWLGCTTSTNTSHSLLSFTSSQQNYNEDNCNKETHEKADNEESDGCSNQDSIVNCRRNLKQKANETSICAQGAHQTKCPRNDETPYYEIPRPKTQCTSYC
jgi:hypothetical protein